MDGRLLTGSWVGWREWPPCLSVSPDRAVGQRAGRGGASSHHQSPSGTPVELLFSLLMDWTESMSVSPHLHLLLFTIPLFLSHTTAKSIKHSVAQSKAVLIKHCVLMKNWANVNPSVGSSQSLQLPDWFVDHVSLFSSRFFYCCSQGHRNHVSKAKGPMCSTLLNCGLTFPKDSPERKEHA